MTLSHLFLVFLSSSITKLSGKKPLNPIPFSIFLFWTLATKSTIHSEQNTQQWYIVLLCCTEHHCTMGTSIQILVGSGKYTAIQLLELFYFVFNHYSLDFNFFFHFSDFSIIYWGLSHTVLLCYCDWHSEKKFRETFNRYSVFQKAYCYPKKVQVKYQIEFSRQKIK